MIALPLCKRPALDLESVLNDHSRYPKYANNTDPTCRLISALSASRFSASSSSTSASSTRVRSSPVPSTISS